MNTKNNRKFQETDAHICATFLDLLETHDFDNISISLLCQKAGITRATFYSHFGDMNHFFDAVAQRLFLELRDEDCANFRKMDSQGELHHASILSLFEHILKYRSFYQVYITRVSQLPFLSVVATFEHTDGIHQYAVRHGITSARQANYCAIFYYTGLTAMIRMWLEDGCPGTPEEMYQLMLFQAKANKNIF